MRLRWMLMVLLGVVTAAAYAPVVTGGFVPFDDDIEITGNAHIQRGVNGESLAWMFTDTAQTERYTPLSWLVWTVLASAFGVSRPWAFHAEALAVHVANALLAFLVLEAVLRRMAGRAPPAGVMAAAAAAAGVWALSPLRLEVVGWVTQVRFAEAALFALLTVLLYLRATGQGQRPPWRTGMFWAAVASYTVSLLFYPSGIGVPAVLVLMDVGLLKRQERLVRLVVEKLPFAGPALEVAIMTVYGRLHAAPIFSAAASMTGFTPWQRMAQAAYIVMYYLWKPFVPLPISPVYTTLTQVDPWDARFAFSLLAVVAITLLVWWYRRRSSAPALLWMAHLALIAPFGGYFEHPHYPSDRYGYLQGVLVAAILGMVVVRYWQQLRRAAIPLLALLAAAMGAASFSLTPLWHDGESLFRYVLARLGDDPYTVDIHERLARVYLGQGRVDEAQAEASKALAIDRAYPPALDVAAQVLNRRGEDLRHGGRPAAIYQPFFARASYTYLLEYQTRQTPEVLSAAALAAANSGDFVHALGAADLFEKAYPDAAAPHVLRAHIRMLQGDETGARNELAVAARIATELEPARLLQQWQAETRPSSP